MNNDEIIKEAEQEIDLFFFSNKLKDIGYTQAVWTLLSVVEDLYFIKREIHQLPNEKLDAYVDSLMSWLSYPLRVCLKESDKRYSKLIRDMIDDHYGYAFDWIRESENYWSFCSIFPLFHRKEIQISITNDELVVDDLNMLGIEYEAYNGLIKKSGNNSPTILDLNQITNIVVANTKFDRKKRTFKIDFNSDLVSELIILCKKGFSDRYNLPEDWRFSDFTISDFKSVFITTQILSLAWNIAKTKAASMMVEPAYKSSVWVVRKQELVSTISKYSKIPKDIVQKIYQKITFGGEGIRDPDIAVQPLIDLYNGYYAISPFVWTNVDSERNLCVLLNQIDSEKKLYLALVQNKEALLRNEFIHLAISLSLDYKHGEIKDTDIDLALIDRERKICLIMEMKWFIEPAETRECYDRSKELKKGVKQALKIKNAYANSDQKLVKEILNIEPDYEFLTIVVSKNWIGHSNVQHPEVPIIKSGDLIKNLESSKSLRKTIAWLTRRDYLPKIEKDFDVHYIDIEVGKWKSKWYGIKPL